MHIINNRFLFTFYVVSPFLHSLYQVQLSYPHLHLQTCYLSVWNDQSDQRLANEFDYVTIFVWIEVTDSCGDDFACVDRDHGLFPDHDPK